MNKLFNKTYRTSAIFLALVVTLTVSSTLLAQDLPKTDLWLADINQGTTGSPVKINPTIGYNNQPHFSVDGDIIYYTREMPHSKQGSQTDIAAYDIASGKTRMVNSNDLSEYSPTPIPGQNALSVIEVEADQTQRLWSIDIEDGDMNLLLPAVEPVGYHAWIDENSVAVFILGEPFTLQTAEIGDGGGTIVAENIGRSIHKNPITGEILYVDKNAEPWQIAALNIETGGKLMIMPLFPGVEDFTIDGNGTYWTANGSKLYSRLPEDESWQLVADFTMSGIGKITRLATNAEASKIAMVSDHPAE